MMLLEYDPDSPENMGDALRDEGLTYAEFLRETYYDARERERGY